MTITDALTAIYLKAVGKATPPTAGTSKYTRIIGLMDFYQRRWSREKGVDWNSLYDPAFSIGAVTATDSFDIDTSTVRKLSDREGDTVRIVWSDGVGYTDYDIVTADSLKDYYYGPNKQSYKGFYCARVGSQLVFNHTFTSNDPQYGGTIKVPCYVFADEINAENPDTDEVKVDDPDWLILMCAAEYVRNDITRRQRYPEILAEANEAMERMKDDNEAQISMANTPWTPPSGIGQGGAWD